MGEHQHTPVEKIDVAQVMKREAFTAALKDANIELELYAFDDETLDILTEKYEQEFDTLLGSNTGLSKARVHATIYLTDNDEIATGEKDIIFHEDTLFVKTTVGMINMLPRVVFMFETPLDIVEDEVSAQQVFYALPEDIIELIIEKEEDEDIPVILEKHAVMSKETVAGKDFLAASFGDQIGGLEVMTDAIEEDILVEHGAFVEVWSKRMIVLYDTTDLPIEECVIDQTDFKDGDGLVVEATYGGVRYVESMVRSLPFRYVSDFSVTAGVPCLFLRSAKENVSYYVPIDKVEKFINYPGEEE